MAKKQADSHPALEQGAGAAKEGPVHEVRLGRIKAVIWANKTESGVRHKLTVKRLFKRDESSQWEQSDSLGRDDIPVAMEVLHQAWLWIYDNA